MLERLVRGFFLSAICLLFIHAAFASDAKNATALQMPQQPKRNEKPKRKHPNFMKQMKSVHVIGIAPPHVQAIHYINNIPEPRDDWAQAARRGALKQIKRRLDDYSIQNKVLDAQGATAEELEDVYALYAAIQYSIDKHTKKGKNLFYDKFATFDYSVGPVGAILDKTHVDALLLTTVYGVIYSKSLHASSKGCVTTAAIIDRSGALLFRPRRHGGHALSAAEGGFRGHHTARIRVQEHAAQEGGGLFPLQYSYWYYSC
jgi:hypothetical protein